MQFITRFWLFEYFNRVPKIRETPREDVTINLLTALYVWESKLMTLQSLLIWENPKFSIAAFLVFTGLFWLISLIGISVVTKLSLIILVIFITHEWVTLIWPEISVPREAEEDWTTLHPNIMSIHEIGINIESSYTKIVKQYNKVCLFRKKKPGMFCVITVGIFFVTLTIGTIIPGSILLYLCITFFAVVPGMSLYITLPPFIQSVYNFCLHYLMLVLRDLNSSEESYLDEFIPDAKSADINDILNVELPNKKDGNQDSPSLPSEKSSTDNSFCNSDDDDSLIPVTDYSLEKTSSKTNMDAGLAEYKNEAQKFESNLIAGLRADTVTQDLENMEEMPSGRLTWLNRDLYKKIVENYFNPHSNNESNSSSDSS